MEIPTCCWVAPPAATCTVVLDGVHTGGVAPDGAVVAVTPQVSARVPLKPEGETGVTVKAGEGNGSVAVVNPCVTVIPVADGFKLKSSTVWVRDPLLEA